MRVFDTHAHYDSGAFNADRLELLAGMPQQDVALIVNPGCDLETSRTVVELADPVPLRLRCRRGTSLRLWSLAGQLGGRTESPGRPPQGEGHR